MAAVVRVRVSGSRNIAMSIQASAIPSRAAQPQAASTHPKAHRRPAPPGRRRRAPRPFPGVDRSASRTRGSVSAAAPRRAAPASAWPPPACGSSATSRAVAGRTGRCARRPGHAATGWRAARHRRRSGRWSATCARPGAVIAARAACRTAAPGSGSVAGRAGASVLPAVEGPGCPAVSVGHCRQRFGPRPRPRAGTARRRPGRRRGPDGPRPGCAGRRGRVGWRRRGRPVARCPRAWTRAAIALPSRTAPAGSATTATTPIAQMLPEPRSSCMRPVHRRMAVRRMVVGMRGPVMARYRFPRGRR